MNGWAETTTAREDLKESLRAASDKILNFTGFEHSDPVFIMSQSAYHQFATFCLREEWREKYRAARVLGDREMAFKHYGARRRYQKLDLDGWGVEG